MSKSNFSLLLFLSISIISIIKADDPLFDFSYPIKCVYDDEKPKSKVCALLSGKQYIIKENCSKDEKCTFSTDNPNMAQCVKRLSPKLIGEKCKYNEECITNNCEEDKCVGLKEQGKCREKKCGYSYACTQLEDIEESEEKTSCENTCNSEKNPPSNCVEECLKDKNECLPLLKEESEQVCLADKIRCAFGYKCNDAENYSVEGKNLTSLCKKFGSVHDEGDSDEPLVCISGMTYDGKCVSVISDGSCSKNEEDGNYYCVNVVLKGNYFDPSKKKVKCKTYILKGDTKYYKCPLNKLKQILWKKYMKRYEELEGNGYFEKVRKDKNNFYDNGDFKFTFGDEKLRELDIIYYNAEQMELRNLIDKDGEIKEATRCEFDFLMSQLNPYFTNSNNINFNYFMFILIVGFLL